MKLIFFTFIILLLCGCGNDNSKQEISKIAADSIVMHIDKYYDTKVETEGVIIHLCGVDGKKMKLISQNGAIINIVPQDSLTSFGKHFYKKKIRVYGLVKEFRIDKHYIDQMEDGKTLLCHIDNTPCKDSVWVKRQINSGLADSLSCRDILKLRTKMEVTQKDYVSVITIFAEKCVIIE